MKHTEYPEEQRDLMESEELSEVKEEREELSEVKEESEELSEVEEEHHVKPVEKHLSRSKTKQTLLKKRSAWVTSKEGESTDSTTDGLLWYRSNFCEPSMGFL
ncbi:unnamed protein product [Leuciscus chuanchicus]